MITVIIPSFNYSQFLGQCIESVISQSYEDWELIVVDDCSTDNSAKVVQSYVNKLPNKIKLVRLDVNSGYSKAKNVGIKASAGDFITCIDADDLLTPHSLELRLSAFQEHPDTMWCHGRALCFSSDPNHADLEEDLYGRWTSIKTKKWPKAKAWQAVHAQSVMFRRDLYKKIGLYDETMRCSSDREMWRRVFNQGYWPAFVHRPVCLYRYHDKQMHKSSYKQKNKDKINRYMDEISEIRKNGINSSNTPMLET